MKEQNFQGKVFFNIVLSVRRVSASHEHMLCRRYQCE